MVLIGGEGGVNVTTIRKVLDNASNLTTDDAQAIDAGIVTEQELQQEVARSNPISSIVEPSNRYQVVSGRERSVVERIHDRYATLRQAYEHAGPPLDGLQAGDRLGDLVTLTGDGNILVTATGTRVDLYGRIMQFDGTVTWDLFHSQDIGGAIGTISAGLSTTYGIRLVVVVSLNETTVARVYSYSRITNTERYQLVQQGDDVNGAYNAQMSPDAASYAIVYHQATQLDYSNVQVDGNDVIQNLFESVESVALVAGVLLVGVPDEGEAGAVYVNGARKEFSVLTDKFVNGIRWGDALAITPSGRFAAVAGANDDRSVNAVALLDLSNDSRLIQTLTEKYSIRSFGTSLAMTDAHLAIGAPDTDDSKSKKGFIYVYDLCTDEEQDALTLTQEVPNELGESCCLAADVMVVGMPAVNEGKGRLYTLVLTNLKMLLDRSKMLFDRINYLELYTNYLESQLPQSYGVVVLPPPTDTDGDFSLPIFDIRVSEAQHVKLKVTAISSEGVVYMEVHVVANSANDNHVDTFVPVATRVGNPARIAVSADIDNSGEFFAFNAQVTKPADRSEDDGDDDYWNDSTRFSVNVQVERPRTLHLG